MGSLLIKITAKVFKDDQSDETKKNDEQDTLIKMREYSVLTRGGVIEAFTFLELFINEINRLLTFDSPDAYEEYMQILKPGELPMNAKKQLFKMCIDKYEKARGKDLTELKMHLDTVIEQRNALAHWPLDHSKESQMRFKKYSKITYLTPIKNNPNKFEYKYFDRQSADALFEKVHILTEIAQDVINDIEANPFS